MYSYIYLLSAYIPLFSKTGNVGSEALAAHFAGAEQTSSDVAG